MDPSQRATLRIWVLLLVVLSITQFASGVGIRGQSLTRHQRQKSVQVSRALKQKTTDEVEGNEAMNAKEVEGKNEAVNAKENENDAQEKDVNKNGAEKDIDEPTTTPTIDRFEPTLSPTGEATFEPALAPTSLPPTVVETEAEQQQAKEEKQVSELEVTEMPESATLEPQDVPDENEERPTAEPTKEEKQVEETYAPTVSETEAPTTAPIVVSEGDSPTRAPTDSKIELIDGTTPPDVSTASNSTTEEFYAIRLEPFYTTITMSGEASEDGFMDILIDYMEHYMVKDFANFVSITYGVSTFEKITESPADTAARSQEQNDGTPASPISNVTVHVHLLAANFDGRPTVPNAVIKEYMEMLLENPETLQEYINNELDLDASIYAIDYYGEEVLPPTDVVDVTISGSNSSTASVQQGSTQDGDDGDKNVGAIVGITVGCFVAVLWMVFLYGVQSRTFAATSAGDNS